MSFQTGKTHKYERGQDLERVYRWQNDTEDTLRELKRRLKPIPDEVSAVSGVSLPRAVQKIHSLNLVKRDVSKM